MKTIATATILSLLLAPVVLQGGEAGESHSLRMKIEGMTCGLCEAKVKKQLSSVCKEVTISLEKGEGVCRYEGSVKPEEIISAANRSGFKTTKLD